MSLLVLFSGILNIVLSIVAVVFINKVDKLEKKLSYTEASLERADENNRRMLEAIDAQRYS